MKRIFSIIVALIIFGWTVTVYADTFGFVTNGTSYNLFFCPGSTNTEALGINNAGQIVGVCVDSDYALHGFMKDGDIITPFDYSGAIETRACGINDAGQIVGTYSNSDWVTYGFLKDGDTYTTIAYPGAYYTDVAGINDAGQIVGSYKDSSVDIQGVGWHGYVMDGYTYTSIDYPGSSNCEASGINDFGQVVGYYWEPYAEPIHGFLKDQNIYSSFDIPEAAFSSTYPLAINNAGQVIVYTPGTAYLKEGDLYTPIRHPFGQFTYANGINDSGKIVGSTEIYFNIGIDIKPGEYPNSINPGSTQKIPVAILSTEYFDAPSEVNQDFLSFGSTRRQAKPSYCDTEGEDVNSDGYKDLVCYFNAHDTGFQFGDTEGFLKSQIFWGYDEEGFPIWEPILGYDVATIIPTLTTITHGTGSGIITSNPIGISCGTSSTDCTEGFIQGTTVTLSATPDTGSVFGGWSGGCSGTGACEVTMNADITVAATLVLSDSPPSLSPTEGTIGTQLTIIGAGFGIRKGKVLIGGVPIEIGTDDWKNNRITCTITKVLPEGGPYHVTIRPYRADDITLPDAFTVKPPEIDSLDHTSGVAGTSITITGNFFGIKKGKVYLEYEKSGKLKKKNCKVKSWDMDSIIFFVPKTSKSFSAKEYTLKVTNKVGEDSTTFTVE